MDTRPNAEQKTRSVRVPMTPAERRRIEALAASRGLTMSAMIRLLVLEASATAGLP
jgi:hypothetical protein